MQDTLGKMTKAIVTSYSAASTSTEQVLGTQLSYKRALLLESHSFAVGRAELGYFPG